MSNVLIGIIGVILFIGLALAGALFLGPRFQEATINSNAASVSTMMRQYVSAANLYELDTGNQIKAVSNQTGSFLTPGYMKSAPDNPYSTQPVYPVDFSGSGISGNPVSLFYTNLGSDDKSKAICVAIERGAGASDPTESSDSARVGPWATRVNNNKRLGCLLNTGSGKYQAYAWL